MIRFSDKPCQKCGDIREEVIKGALYEAVACWNCGQTKQFNEKGLEQTEAEEAEVRKNAAHP